jgi:hypothetical protein
MDLLDYHNRRLSNFRNDGHSCSTHCVYLTFVERGRDSEIVEGIFDSFSGAKKVMNLAAERSASNMIGGGAYYVVSNLWKNGDRAYCEEFLDGEHGCQLTR